jgi:hypothetical protein
VFAQLTELLAQLESGERGAGAGHRSPPLLKTSVSVTGLLRKRDYV